MRQVNGHNHRETLCVSVRRRKTDTTTQLRLEDPIHVHLLGLQPGPRLPPFAD